MLASKVMLVYLGISQWTGRKLDKRATHTVESSHSTDVRVGNYTKKLLPAAKELAKISALAGAIRNFYYEQTLPWMHDGGRVISSKNYFEFTTEFNKRKIDFESAVAEFLVQYPNLREAARFKLGDLFNESEYPTEAKLQYAFKCKVKFAPLADVSDFRTEVLDADKIAYESDFKRAQSDAIAEVWNRLYSVIANATDKLKDPKAHFKNSLIDNIQDMATLLPKLNITDCPQLEAKRIEVETVIAGISPDICRTNVNEREAAVKQLKEIQDSMSGIMGSLSND